MLSMDFTGARNSHKLPYHKFPPHSHKLPPLLEFLIGAPQKKKNLPMLVSFHAIHNALLPRQAVDSTIG